MAHIFFLFFLFASLFLLPFGKNNGVVALCIRSLHSSPFSEAQTKRRSALNAGIMNPRPAPLNCNNSAVVALILSLFLTFSNNNRNESLKIDKDKAPSIQSPKRPHHAQEAPLATLTTPDFTDHSNSSILCLCPAERLEGELLCRVMVMKARANRATDREPAGFYSMEWLIIRQSTNQCVTDILARTRT